MSLTLEMIRELDAVREQALEAQHDSASRTVKALCKIRGIGVNFASVLTRTIEACIAARACCSYSRFNSWPSWC
jgi:hypothetical protein